VACFHVTHRHMPDHHTSTLPPFPARYHYSVLTHKPYFLANARCSTARRHQKTMRLIMVASVPSLARLREGEVDRQVARCLPMGKAPALGLLHEGCHTLITNSFIRFMQEYTRRGSHGLITNSCSTAGESWRTASTMGRQKSGLSASSSLSIPSSTGVWDSALKEGGRGAIKRC